MTRRCGLYKKLAPELKKLGTSLKKVKSVSMGKTLPNKQFPHGLRVLLVGSDQATLRIIEKMSSRCNYHVTKCSEAAVALNLLRERKGCFDIVLSDDYMEDMDSDKFIQHVQLEINLPLVIISSDERTSSVMKGLRNGACDYLIKPVREEVWRNIWQHVWRRQLKVKKEYENSGCFEDNHDRNIQRNYDDDAEATTSLLDATRKEGIVNAPTKRSIKEEDDGELVNNDDPPLKKRRVVWSAELHEQFVSAVNQLGLDKAVPKAILELMNVHGLTRENVASHLQKYRLFLKRLSGEGHHHQHINGMPINTISGSAESKLGRSDIEALARLTPQAVAVFHPDLLVYHHPNHNPLLEHSKNSPHHSILTLEDVTSLGWSHNSNTNIPSSVGPNGGMGGLVHDKNVLLNILHQHRLHQQKQQGNFSYGTIPPSSTSISSCTASASIIHQQQQNPALGLPYGTKCGDDALNLAAEPVRNHGFVIPTRYSPLEMESSVNDLKEGNIAVVDSDHNTVNEPNMDLIDNLGVGLSPVLQRFPSFDYTFME